MKSGNCPKCGSEEVYVKRKNIGGGNNIPIGSWWQGAVPFDNYVCASCGYVENYISDVDTPSGDGGILRYISEHWERADGRTSQKRKRDEGE